jgi:ribosome-associated heat shock protein Hsp15
MGTAKPERVRLDKWLWAARLYKTRALAANEIDKGRVTVNGRAAKPGRELRVGDRLQLRKRLLLRTLVVKALNDVRGPAAVAQALYAETPESAAARAAALEQRRLGLEPSQGIEAGRPTKRDRRKLVEWSRWSASIGDEDDDAK